jgi:nucleoid-associated protein YgaU
MDQVSRPVLIAFAATLALLAIWFVALRPKPVPVAATPLAPTQAIAPAQQAAAASDAATAQAQAAGTAAATPAASAPTAAPAAAAATPATAGAPSASDGRRDGAILRDIRHHKVVVVLFWNARAADDIATRGAIRDLDLRGGKVAVHVVPIGRVGEYPAITQGVTIAQSPTTLVIDRKRRTRVITGLSEPQELTQAVGDALAGR